MVGAREVLQNHGVVFEFLNVCCCERGDLGGEVGEEVVAALDRSVCIRMRES